MYEEPGTWRRILPPARAGAAYAMRVDAAVRALLNAMQLKDHTTATHMQRLAGAAAAIGHRLGLRRPELAALHRGALLHDIGKLGVDSRILRNPGPLTPNERRIMGLHPLLGQQIVEPLQLATAIVAIIRHHHERWDGRGYPDGLAGSAIPLGARIVAVADAFDAMSNWRPYSQPLPPALARERLLAGASTIWDPQIVAVYLAWHDIAHPSPHAKPPRLPPAR